ncbi:MAG: hypothetical protein LBF89_09555 [Bacteroidales bacterium]|jgi:hypothetical protein|nr:hypothetical protein [Bacteroidales bacterium]
MKKIALLLLMTVFVGSWYMDRYERDATYRAIFMSRSNLENSVSYIPGERELKNTGKIYCRAPYIYINERYKGVHVINNSDPAHPVCEGFILAPGCIDMAVKDNIVYLDNAVDLVAFDLTSRTVTERIKDVFPEPKPPHDFYYRPYDRPEGYVLVEWRKID